jgi:hypothetical protein
MKVYFYSSLPLILTEIKSSERLEGVTICQNESDFIEEYPHSSGKRVSHY